MLSCFAVARMLSVSLGAFCMATSRAILQVIARSVSRTGGSSSPSNGVQSKWTIIAASYGSRPPLTIRVNSSSASMQTMKSCGGSLWARGSPKGYRYAQVGQQANYRFIDHMAHAELKSKAISRLENLCRSHTQNGKRCARFSPLSQGRANFVYCGARMANIQ